MRETEKVLCNGFPIETCAALFCAERVVSLRIQVPVQDMSEGYLASHFFSWLNARQISVKAHVFPIQPEPTISKTKMIKILIMDRTFTTKATHRQQGQHIDSKGNTSATHHIGIDKELEKMARSTKKPKNMRRLTSYFGPTAKRRQELVEHDSNSVPGDKLLPVPCKKEEIKVIEILDLDEQVEQVIEIVEDYATETTEAASCARPSTEEDGDNDASKTKAAHHATMKKMTKIHDNVTRTI